MPMALDPKSLTLVKTEHDVHNLDNNYQNQPLK